MRELPRRKRNRLAGYDYRQNGAYFVTICAKDRAELFGTIAPGTPVGATVPGRPHCENDPGRPCETVPGRRPNVTVPGRPNESVPGHPHIQLTELGRIVDTAIQHNNRDGITIDRYVIMPNHVHMIVMITDENGVDFGTGDGGRTTGGEKYPTGDRGQSTGDRGRAMGDRGRAMGDRGRAMGDRGRAMGDRGQSTGDRGRAPLQTVIRNMKSYISKQIGFSPWQKSFHDHIIRNEDEYFRIAQYIQDNPINWQQDCFFTGAGNGQANG